MGNMIVEERNVDAQGRVSLPNDWRKRHLKKGNKVIITQIGDDIIIKPIKTQAITDFFDIVKVDITSDLGDWKEVKKELLTGESP